MTTLIQKITAHIQHGLIEFGQQGNTQEARAVQTFNDYSNISTTKLSSSKSTKSTAMRLSMHLSMLAFAIGAAVIAPQVQAQVQPIVATSTLNLTPANGVATGPSVVDACGNVYVNQSGSIVEFAHDTGTQTVISANGQGYGGPNPIAIDSTKTYMYFPVGTSTNNQWYGSAWSVVTLSNCVPSGPTTFPATGVSYLFGYYFGTAAVLGTDGYGDVFFTTTQGPNAGLTIAEIGCSASGGVACTTYPSGTNAAILTAPLTHAPTSIAGDSHGNVYFTNGSTSFNGTSIYKLTQPNVTTAAKTPYTPVAVASGFVNAVAVTTDTAGNLYIVDSNGYSGGQYYNTTFNAIVYEVPNEGGTLNFAHMYVVTNNTGIASQPAVDANGNIFYTSYPPGNEQNLWEVLRGAVKIPAVADGTATSASINYYFNTATTTGTFNYSGTSGATLAANGGTCSAAHSYAANSSCTLGVSYTPTLPGFQPAGVNLLSSTNGLLLATPVAGTGLGAAITIDPGLQAAFTTSFHTPTAVAVDFNNNYYVVDSYLNTVTQFTNGSLAGTPITIGNSITLSGPSGVTVDGLGNVYIADTGNNRIVEVPFLNGALVGSSATALSISAGGTALKSPAGLAVGPYGGLYIADTGNNRVVYVPSRSGALAPSAALAYGSGLSGPLGVALDLNGNLFVTDTGHGNIVRLSSPLASGTQTNVVTGLSNPSAVSVDASGSLFVVDKGNYAVEKYALISGLFGSASYVGGTVATPYGVALDAHGNLLVTDNTHGTATLLNRANASLPFGNWNVNATSTPLTANINNAGNGALIFGATDYTSAGATTQFNVSSDNCASSTVVTGNSCLLTATFKPTVAAVNATDTLTYSSNAVGSATLKLVGTGEPINTSTTTITLTAPASGTLSAGVSATFSATVGIGSQTVAPTGYITFYVNGTQDGPKILVSSLKSGYGASVTFPNGLPAGAVFIVAVYSGDGNYSGSQGSINETVVGLNATLTLVATTPYTSPQSVNDVRSASTGPAVPLTASLTGTTGIIPSGHVSFYSATTPNPTLLGTANLAPVSGGFAATISETALRALTGTTGENNSVIDNYAIYATYSGDNYYVPESSNVVPLTVVAAPATLPACATAAKPTCQVNTTGATFTIAPTNPSLTIQSSSASGPVSGTVLLTVTSYGGWTGVLNFTCSNLPVNTICSPYPGAPVVNASTSTSPAALTTVQFILYTNTPPVVATGSFVWWLCGGCGLALLLVRRRLTRLGLYRRGVGEGLALLLLLVASFGTMTGCSGSSLVARTPTGTSNVLVTVHAAQLVPGTTTAASQAPDSNVGSFTIALTVQ
jgi:sugar lactone lactonase YvrE